MAIEKGKVLSLYPTLRPKDGCLHAIAQTRLSPRSSHLPPRILVATWPPCGVIDRVYYMGTIIDREHADGLG